MNFVQEPRYRNDVDGLRALAVLAIIAFHSGYLPKGFLGVDVFFTISGFFITKLIYEQVNNTDFSLIAFYRNRARRIMPLTLFIGLVSLALGIATMLPDDLENLAQSVIATNFFINNILQAITTKNYWDVVNEYKPLMHAWYLGVIVKYYVLYPPLIMLVMKKRPTWLVPILLIFGGASLTLYLLPYFAAHEKFYLIIFRFWEFAAGGIAAVALKDKLIKHKYSFLLAFLLASLMCFDFSFIPSEIILLSTVLLSVCLLVISNKENKLCKFLLENKLFVAIGKISFGLYLWHQVLLAFARYGWVQALSIVSLFAVYIATIALTMFSYFLIEKPFSDINKIHSRAFLLITGCVFLLTSLSSLYIYVNAGILRDVPELGIYKSEAVRNLHAKYNDRIHDYDKKFSSINRIKVLVIGNSFARDWANVLLESKYSKNIELSYISNPYSHKELKDRVGEADIIFYSTPELHQIQKLEIPETKLWAVGTKNYGTNSGIFYNYKGINYYQQRTLMEKGYLEKNDIMKKKWGSKYIDYIGKVINENHTVPVFTPSQKFISQDCRHFTKAGAQYFAYLFQEDLDQIIKNVKK